jgi:hypothetical protein
MFQLHMKRIHVCLNTKTNFSLLEASFEDQKNNAMQKRVRPYWKCDSLMWGGERIRMMILSDV